jgi:hypothetical protein
MRDSARRCVGFTNARTVLLRAIAGSAETRDRIERAATAPARLGDERANVGLVRTLERALGHDHVARRLVLSELRV